MDIRVLLFVAVLGALCSENRVSAIVGMSVGDLVRNLENVTLFVGSVEITNDAAGFATLLSSINQEATLAGLTAFERIYVIYYLIHFENLIFDAAGKSLTSIDLLDVLNPQVSIQMDAEDVNRMNQVICDELGLLDLNPMIIARKKRKVTAVPSLKWPTTTIPYRITADFDSLDAAFRQAILDAITHWETETCLDFNEVADTTTGSHLVFRSLGGCWSYLGHKSYPQIISTTDGCGQFAGAVIKLIGHALGFWHENQRPDRNSFINVLEDNIIEGNLHRFIRRSWSEVLTYGLPYDYSSLYHFSAARFSKNPPTDRTIDTIDPAFVNTIGPKNELSFFDAKLANLHYCQGSCSGGLEPSSCQNGGYKNPRSCTQCKCPDGLVGDCTSAASDVNAVCGNNQLTATSTPQTITSPGLDTTGHLQNQECSWLITAGPFERIKITIQRRNLGCTQPCRDYLEIRSGLLSHPGARLCCTPDSSPEILYATGNQALINFRTTTNAVAAGMGFQLTFETEPCGGCDPANPSATSGPACETRESYTCPRSFVQNGITMYRLNTCFRTRRSCCSGFQQNANICQRDVSDWSAWTTCTETCGGCGTQTRTRTCLVASCSVPLTQSRSCNNNLCPVRYMSRRRSYRARCRSWWWWNRYCIRYYSVRRAIYCCGDKVRVGNQCA